MCKILRPTLFVALTTILVVSSCYDIPFQMDLGFVTTAHFQCVREKYSQIITWIVSTQQSIQPSTIQTFLNAKNAGLSVQIAFMPCRIVDPFVHVAWLKQQIGPNDADIVWVYPMTSEDCKWELDYWANCQFLVDLVELLKKQGFVTGVAVFPAWWTSTLGSREACKQLSNEPLAWMPLYDEQDHRPDFDSYQQIGGWVKPTMKLYKGDNICGRVYFINYYE